MRAQFFSDSFALGFNGRFYRLLKVRQLLVVNQPLLNRVSLLLFLCLQWLLIVPFVGMSLALHCMRPADKERDGPRLPGLHGDDD